MEAKKRLRAVAAVALKKELEREQEEQRVEDERGSQVVGAREAGDERENADQPEAESVEQALHRGGRARGIVALEHDKAGLGVFVAVHPRDGQEVRHLPGEEDAEEHPGAEVQRGVHRGPADHRRDGARDRSDDGAEGGAALQRGVEQDVKQHGGECEAWR